jgi:iron complex outermembrane receptor protein
MGRLFLFMMLFGFWANSIYAQVQELKIKIVDGHNQAPIPGALIQVKGSELAGVSDLDGIVNLQKVPSDKITIIVSMLGYETEEFAFGLPLAEGEEFIILELHEDHEELEAVMVVSTRSSRTISNTPTRIEIIAGEELDEKANMKPGDIRLILSESTGIMVQVTSPTSANASIRIQGLDGRYTQLLKDGFPLYSGAASGLSLLQIPPLDLQQVEVIKGSASTLYGGGAIAGLVNLISKRPQLEGQTNFLLNGTNAGGFDISGFHGKRNEKWGTTVFGAYNSNQPYDPADIGLSAIPKFTRFTFNPKLFMYPSQKTDAEFGVNFNYEDRKGGNMELLKGNESNPNAFFENNESLRLNSQLEVNHRLSENKKIQFKNAFNFFDRKLSSGDYVFHGSQRASFSEMNYRKDGEGSDWVFGANLWTESFNEINAALDRSYTLETIGIFAQNTWDLDKKWSLESGLRTDYVPDFGWAVLPRAGLLWKANQAFSSRLGGGLGYKAPTIFTEETERLQFNNVLPIDPDLNVLERSYGLNWDLNYKANLFDDRLSLSINHLFFYTYLDRPLFLSDPVGGFYSLENINGFADTRGMETNIKWEWNNFKWFMGYTFTDAEISENNQRRIYPLNPKHRINSVLFYEVHESIKIGWESYYFSKQVLSDGSIGQDYLIMGFMAEKIWENFSLYINFENFLDARQTRFDSIFTGSIDTPTFREIYAPLDGFVINGGVKIRL